MVDVDIRSKKGRTIQGRYANYFEVGHNVFEFIVDFGQFHPEISSAQFHTRIVTGPTYAKLLLMLLEESINKYEADHGVIMSPDIDDTDPLEFVKSSIADFDFLGSGTTNRQEK